MPAISFPYLLEKSGEGHHFYRPKIPVVLRNQERELEVLALVDSGADMSVLSRKAGEALGIDMKGKITKLEGFEGKEIDAITTSVNLEIEKGNERFRIPSLEVKVPLTGENETASIILGRIGFFTEFDITFRENSKRIELVKVRH